MLFMSVDYLFLNWLTISIITLSFTPLINIELVLLFIRLLHLSFVVIRTSISLAKVVPTCTSNRWNLQLYFLSCPLRAIWKVTGEFRCFTPIPNNIVYYFPGPLHIIFTILQYFTFIFLRLYIALWWSICSYRRLYRRGLGWALMITWS